MLINHKIIAIDILSSPDKNLSSKKEKSKGDGMSNIGTEMRRRGAHDFSASRSRARPFLARHAKKNLKRGLKRETEMLAI